MAVVSVEEFAQHMNMTTPQAESSEYRKLAEHLDSAIENVEARVGPLSDVAQTYPVHASGKYLVLPVTHVTQVTTLVDPSGNTVTLNPANVDLLSGVITMPYSRTGAWQVTASTREHAASVKLAVKIIAAHLWETQRGRGDATRAGMFGGGGDDTVPNTPIGFAVPSRAADLLAPFVLPGIG